MHIITIEVLVINWTFHLSVHWVYFTTKKSRFKPEFYIFVFCSKTKSQKPYRVNGSWWADQKTRNELGSSRAVNLCLACAKTDFSGLPKITELPPLAVRRSRGPSTDCVEFYAAISIFHSICEVLLFYLTANIFESGPIPTPWKFLAGPPLLPSCKSG